MSASHKLCICCDWLKSLGKSLCSVRKVFVGGENHLRYHGRDLAVCWAHLMALVYNFTYYLGKEGVV